MSEWMLEETIRLSRELTAAQFRIAEQRDEITALQCELEQAQTAIAEMRGERACTCESLLSRESDNISLRAALGRAVEALQARQQVMDYCREDCDFCREDSCEHAEYHRLDYVAESLAAPVLGDPEGQAAAEDWERLRAALGRALDALWQARTQLLETWDRHGVAYTPDDISYIERLYVDDDGQKAGQEWAAMVEAAEVLRRIDKSATLCDYGRVGDSCVAHMHLNAARDALRRLAEVREQKGGEE